MSRTSALLHVHKLGKGPRPLLAFHGIAQTGDTCFEPLEKALGDIYTIYAFDMPFHGQSPEGSLWDEKGQPYAFSVQHPLTKGAWTAFVEDFLETHQITTFDLVGFSMGGRFVLATLEAFPERIGTVYLIAADGIVEHPFYHMATRIAPIRWLYRQLLHRPAPILLLGRAAVALRLLPKGILRFVSFMLATPQRRQVIFRSWVSLRELTFDSPVLGQNAQQQGVAVWLFLGEYDPMLTPKEVVSFAKILPPERVVLLPSGHGRIVEKTAHYLSTFFKA